MAENKFSGSVPETAAGTGVLTDRLINALAADTQIIATDFSPAMLEVAESK